MIITGNGYILDTDHVVVATLIGNQVVVILDVFREKVEINFVSNDEAQTLFANLKRGKLPRENYE